MSAILNDAPFAVGSDGTVFVNMTHHSGVADAVELLNMALAAKGAVFIGVSLERHEVDEVLERLGHGAREAAAFILGARRGHRS